MATDYQSAAKRARAARTRADIEAFTVFDRKREALKAELGTRDLDAAEFAAQLLAGTMELHAEYRRARNRARRQNTAGNLLVADIRREIEASR